MMPLLLSLPVRSGFTGTCGIPGLVPGSWDPNSDPHDCTTSTLSTEPPLQSCTSFLNSLYWQQPVMGGQGESLETQKEGEKAGLRSAGVFLASPREALKLAMCVYTCMCAHTPKLVCVHSYRFPWPPEEGIRSRGAEVTGSCVPPSMSAGSPTKVLCKSIFLNI